MEKVLVTGASGYIALHCITELLKNGYAVKGSLRSMSRENEVRESVKKEVADDNLEFCKLDLMSDDGWGSCASDCNYMIHLASPFIVGEPKNENELIKPATEGTMRALNAAKKAGIKKVVLTSSIVAIAYGHNQKICSSHDWTNTDKDVGAYNKSKTLAEKAAWNFIEHEGHPFQLAVINPALVIGPTLSDDLGVSNAAIEMVVTGKMPVAIPIQFGYVDVRDVASAHILAMQNDSSNGERFALAERDLWYKDIAKLLRDNGYNKAPTFSVPIWLAKFLANFSNQLKITLPFIGRVRSVAKTSKAKDLLGWNPRPAEESILATANQIKDLGLIK